MGSLDYKTFKTLAHSIRDANFVEPLERIRDYAERRALKPHELLVVSFEKSTVTVERDLRSTVTWRQEYKRTVEKALTPEFARVIGSMEKSGHHLSGISHPDRYSREIDQWTKSPSKDLEPVLDLEPVRERKG